MSRSGWCRVCGEWVQIGDAGTCPAGHSTEHIERVHKIADSFVQGIRLRPFGVGKMPADLQRFNWGAFFLPYIWGIIYGSWPVMSAWFIAFISPSFIRGLLAEGGGGELVGSAAVIAAAVAGQAIESAVRLWSGANATRLVWKHEALRLELLPNARPRYTIERYLTRQRAWRTISAILVIVPMGMAIGTLVSGDLPPDISGLQAFYEWEKYGLTHIASVMMAVWLGAAMVLGRWLDTRMQDEPLGHEQRHVTD